MKFFLIWLLFILHCTFRVPAITLTQTQTAAEKQMIGEDRELERDGWLISSIKSSSSGPDDWKKDTLEEFANPDEKKEYYANLKVIAYTATEVKKLKSYFVLGEGMDGKIHPLDVPKNPRFDKEYDVIAKKKIQDLIKIVNDAREKVYVIEKSRNNKIQVLSQNSFSSEGEYIEKSKGKWEIKK